MDNSFVCKIFEGEDFLGTTFLINSRIAYTANHCLADINEYDDCYIDCRGTKYTFNSVKRIEELDFIEITLNDNVDGIEFPKISTECIHSGEKLICYGYKEVVEDILGVAMEIYEYPLVINENEKADCGFMIQGEVDSARWYGISGAPIYNNDLLRGIVLMNCGNDGLQTRIKVVSFNKIINYLVDNNKDDIIENFPDRFISSELNKQLLGNRQRCDFLYYSSNLKIECDNVELKINFYKNYYDINMLSVLDELKKAIFLYALSLEEKYSRTRCLNAEEIDKIYERITEVKKRMNSNFNSMYILLWMFTEGIIGAPRIGRVLVAEGSNYIEEDVYLKKQDDKITLLIPIISRYEDIFTAILNIIRIIMVRKENGFLNLDDIEWDVEAINCLDIKTRVEVGEIMRSNYSKEVNIEITAAALYKSNLYSNIPSEINTKERTERFFENKFKEDFKNKLEKYEEVIEEMNLINEIKINLFILPVTNINSLENI